VFRQTPDGSQNARIHRIEPPAKGYNYVAAETGWE
jgi:hypothetical protein